MFCFYLLGGTVDAIVVVVVVVVVLLVVSTFSISTVVTLVTETRCCSPEPPLPPFSLIFPLPLYNNVSGIESDGGSMLLSRAVSVVILI